MLGLDRFLYWFFVTSWAESIILSCILYAWPTQSTLSSNSILLPALQTTLGTTAGIILGILIVVFRFFKAINKRLEALLAEHAYLAPTYSANSCSNSFTIYHV